MDNLVIVSHFNWAPPPRSQLVRTVEWLSRRLGLAWRIERAMDPQRDMTNLAQRENLWHFASQVLAYGVPGEFAEFGCFDGQAAVIFQKVIDELDPSRRLHLYDHFQISFALTGRDIRQELVRNFEKAQATLPVIHEGDFNDTIPGQLPEQLAFVHIDCGFGGDPRAHEEVVYRLLEQAYPRMSPGAVGVLMDYHEAGRSTGTDFNPGVGVAARRFFEDKPEKMSLLWTGEYTHGYFRRARTP